MYTNTGQSIHVTLQSEDSSLNIEVDMEAETGTPAKAPSAI